MRLASEFRTHAQQCRKLAEEAANPASCAYWTGMAAVWDSLAVHLEETHPQSEQSSVFPPVDLEPSCPCASARRRRQDGCAKCNPP